MRNILKHLIEQPFLVTVSFAALAHSAWSFSVMFTGLEPQPQFTGAWFAWLIPGALLAFSIDVGLLALANQIRGGVRTRAKLAAFGVLSLAMAYAQFVYISSHMPAFPLAGGVRSEWASTVQLLRDCAIWIFPALLPTALILYAFSDAHVAQPETAQPSQALALTTEVDAMRPVLELPEPQSVEIECDECAWAGSYPDAVAARNALTAHRRKHKVTVGSNGSGNTQETKQTSD